jgi:predicted flap endonuclease-1-like 5' DNA nuclease
VKTPAARKELAKKLGMEASAVLELANRADVARINGIGGVFSDLLENAGVDTVKELAKRDPANLMAKLTEVNAKKKLAGRLPTVAQVKDWVDQAKALPKLLEY